MSFLGVVLVVVFVVTAILLIGVVLIQDEQGEGLGGIFGGGSATPFGSRSGNVLTRFTSILGAIFLFCSFGIAWVNRGNQSGNVIAAAARLNHSSTVTEWWNASLNNNRQLSGSNPLPPVTPITTKPTESAVQVGGTTSPAAAAGNTSGGATGAGGASASNTAAAPPQATPSSTNPSASGAGSTPSKSGTPQ